MIAATDRMNPFLYLAGVLVTHFSPFCRDFVTSKDLLKSYIAYFPRTFKYGTISGTNEEFGEVEDSVDVTQMENFIAAVIRQLAKDIDELDNGDWRTWRSISCRAREDGVGTGGLGR